MFYIQLSADEHDFLLQFYFYVCSLLQKVRVAVCSSSRCCHRGSLDDSPLCFENKTGENNRNTEGIIPINQAGHSTEDRKAATLTTTWFQEDA